jgi:hypothetical protein
MGRRPKKRILWINLLNDADTYFKFRFLQGFLNAKTTKETLVKLVNYFLEKENLKEKVEELKNSK